MRGITLMDPQTSIGGTETRKSAIKDLHNSHATNMFSGDVVQDARSKRHLILEVELISSMEEPFPKK